MTLKTLELFEEEAHKSLRALRDYTDVPQEIFGDYLIETGEQILAAARFFAGVACKKCGGRGHIGYSTTATWRRGVAGGMTITEDVCDSCWGSGVTTKTGPNLRELSQKKE